MNWRAVLLSGVLASALGLSVVPEAAAKHYRCQRGGGFQQSGYGRYDGRCAQIADRIELDRSKIAEIAPTGRHRKALQWYKDDLRNAYRDLDRCRYGDDAASYDPDPYSRASRSYDPYDDSDRYDPYYDEASGGRSFDLKRDWPSLLSIFVNSQQ